MIREGGRSVGGTSRCLSYLLQTMEGAKLFITLILFDKSFLLFKLIFRSPRMYTSGLSKLFVLEIASVSFSKKRLVVGGL